MASDESTDRSEHHFWRFRRWLSEDREHLCRDQAEIQYNPHDERLDDREQTIVTWECGDGDE